MKLVSLIFIHHHRHQGVTMILLLKAELWPRTPWMHRKKVDITHGIVNFFLNVPCHPSMCIIFLNIT